MPFIVYNVPSVQETVEKWSDASYLSSKMSNGRFQVGDTGGSGESACLSYAPCSALSVPGESRASTPYREHFFFSHFPVALKTTQPNCFWCVSFGARARVWPHQVESSTSNHFMYFSGSRGPPGWTPPTENTYMTFDQWLDFAVILPMRFICKSDT